MWLFSMETFAQACQACILTCELLQVLCFPRPPPVDRVDSHSIACVLGKCYTSKHKSRFIFQAQLLIHGDGDSSF